jgi:hypothetical protein
MIKIVVFTIVTVLCGTVAAALIAVYNEDDFEDTDL